MFSVGRLLKLVVVSILSFGKTNAFHSGDGLPREFNHALLGVDSPATTLDMSIYQRMVDDPLSMIPKSAAVFNSRGFDFHFPMLDTDGKQYSFLELLLIKITDTETFDPLLDLILIQHPDLNIVTGNGVPLLYPIMKQRMIVINKLLLSGANPFLSFNFLGNLNLNSIELAAFGGLFQPFKAIADLDYFEPSIFRKDANWLLVATLRQQSEFIQKVVSKYNVNLKAYHHAAMRDSSVPSIWKAIIKVDSADIASQFYRQLSAEAKQRLIKKHASRFAEEGKPHLFGNLLREGLSIDDASNAILEYDQPVLSRILLNYLIRFHPLEAAAHVDQHIQAAIDQGKEKIIKEFPDNVRKLHRLAADRTQNGSIWNAWPYLVGSLILLKSVFKGVVHYTSCRRSTELVKAFTVLNKDISQLYHPKMSLVDLMVAEKKSEMLMERVVRFDQLLQKEELPYYQSAILNLQQGLAHTKKTLIEIQAYIKADKSKIMRKRAFKLAKQTQSDKTPTPKKQAERTENTMVIRPVPSIVTEKPKPKPRTNTAEQVYQGFLNDIAEYNQEIDELLILVDAFANSLPADLELVPYSQGRIGYWLTGEGSEQFENVKDSLAKLEPIVKKSHRRILENRSDIASQLHDIGYKWRQIQKAIQTELAYFNQLPAAQLVEFYAPEDTALTPVAPIPIPDEPEKALGEIETKTDEGPTATSAVSTSIAAPFYTIFTRSRGLISFEKNPTLIALVQHFSMRYRIACTLRSELETRHGLRSVAVLRNLMAHMPTALDRTSVELITAMQSDAANTTNSGLLSSFLTDSYTSVFGELNAFNADFEGLTKQKFEVKAYLSRKGSAYLKERMARRIEWLETIVKSDDNDQQAYDAAKMIMAEMGEIARHLPELKAPVWQACRRLRNAVWHDKIETVAMVEDGDLLIMSACDDEKGVNVRKLAHTLVTDGRYFGQVNEIEALSFGTK